MNIIKIGGSVLTDKESGAFDKSAAVAIARNLPSQSIVVHGSGTYGKPPAIEFGYIDGVVKKDLISSILHVRQMLALLNGQFVNTLLENGTSAVGLSAFALFSDDGKRTRFVGHRVIESCFAREITPVIYSDFIFYKHDCLRVLSSDHIVSILARKYRPANAVFATDVDGVFKPAMSGHTVKAIFKHLDRGMLRRNDAGIKRDELDVTGGMFAKVIYAMESARYAARCIILNGHRSARIRTFCAGSRVPGTMVSYKTQ